MESNMHDGTSRRSSLKLKSIRNAEIEGKRVLLRVDFNVPMQHGVITESSRIKAAIPTIEFLKQKGAAHITLVTHLGRPEGKVDESLRTAPLFECLSQLTDTTNMDMLENVRFDAREESNDSVFAKELATHGDVFVNDAFAVCHRAAASTVGVTSFLPSFAGLLVIQEVEQLTLALVPPKNAIAIIGGAKFETKQPLLEVLLKAYPKILLGGALANDLLKARGMPVGSSLVSEMAVPLPLAEDERVCMPDDVRVESDGISRDAQTADVRADERIVDIGPRAEKHWSELIAASEFILWNGPMGIYEKGFVVGTDALAEALVTSNSRAVIGGGDTAAALSKFDFDQSRIFVSTGGGAMLEFIANDGTLPALEVLKK